VILHEDEPALRNLRGARGCGNQFGCQ
jgi:hypothetical protein